jgi:hypothetical protein
MKKSLVENIQELEIPNQVEGVRVGKIVNINESGKVFVDFSGNSRGPLEARFTSSLKLENLRYAASADQEVLLVFEKNDPDLPIIIDTLGSLVDEIMELSTVAVDDNMHKDVTIDGEKVTLDAKEEVVFRCGKASITLTRAGKVLIRGAYLLSRSSGVNRIKGGSVQIN